MLSFVSCSVSVLSAHLEDTPLKVACSSWTLFLILRYFIDLFSI